MGTGTAFRMRNEVPVPMFPIWSLFKKDELRGISQFIKPDEMVLIKINMVDVVKKDLSVCNFFSFPQVYNTLTPLCPTELAGGMIIFLNTDLKK